MQADSRGVALQLALAETRLAQFFGKTVLHDGDGIETSGCALVEHCVGDELLDHHQRLQFGRIGKFDVIAGIVVDLAPDRIEKQPIGFLQMGKGVRITTRIGMGNLRQAPIGGLQLRLVRIAFNAENIVWIRHACSLAPRHVAGSLGLLLHQKGEV